MAVAPKHTPVTREMVYDWITQHSQAKNPPSLEDFIRAKVDDLGLDDPMIDTSQRDDFEENEVHVADLIIPDLDSYATGS